MCNLRAYLVLALILDHMFIHLPQLYEDKEDNEKERKGQSFLVCDKLLYICLILTSPHLTQEGDERNRQVYEKEVSEKGRDRKKKRREKSGSFGGDKEGLA